MSKQSDLIKVSQDAGTTGFVNTTGDRMSGDLFIDGDSSGTRSLVLTEWGSDDYGAAMSYDAVADELYVGTRSGSTTTTKAIRIARGATDVGVVGRLTANGVTSNSTFSVSGDITSYSGGGYCPAAGTFGFNLESKFGLYTNGMLIVYGNENGVNQTIRMYTWNLSFYGYASSTRYVRLREIHSNVLNNGYGNVFAYIPAYAGSWTTTDQSSSNTSSSVCDIYFRNAVGQGCSYHYTLWRT